MKIEQIKPAPADGKGMRADGASEPWFAPWVYLREDARFYDKRTGEKIGKASFDQTFRADAFGKLPSTHVAENSLIETVANEIYYPSPNGGGEIIELNGRKYINSYRPIANGVLALLTAEQGRAIDVVKDHIGNLFASDKDAAILIDFMAYVVQNPGERVNWAVVLKGPQGNGKSAIIKLMCDILGRNARVINGNDVKGRFTDWAAGVQFIAVEEIKVHGRQKYEVLDHLKPYITNETVSIEPKGLQRREVPNFASYMMTTNHDDALPITAGDRRYCILRCCHETADDIAAAGMNEGYFRDLFRAINKHPEALAHWLLTHGISDSFEPQGRAPDTAGRRRMIDDAVSDTVVAVEAAIDCLRCDVINDDVVDVTLMRERSSELPSWITLPEGHRAIGKALGDLGYIKIATSKGRVKVNGRGCRYIYRTPDRPLLDTGEPLSDTQIGEIIRNHYN